jgi:lysozyme
MYTDSVGVPTIGYGHNLNVPISKHAADVIFIDDFRAASANAKRIPVFDALSPVRQAVLIEMVFNMGLQSVLGFRQMLAHLEAGRYDAAAMEMLNSRWARQVGPRAKNLSEIMSRGVWLNGGDRA